MLTMLRAGCCCAAAMAPSIRTKITVAAIGRAIRIIVTSARSRWYRNRGASGILPATEFRAARNRHEVREIPKPKPQNPNQNRNDLGWDLGFGAWDLRFA